MMDDDDVQAGQEVKLSGQHRRGEVLEVDRQMSAARVRLNGQKGEERWVRTEELEPIRRWGATEDDA